MNTEGHDTSLNKKLDAVDHTFDAVDANGSDCAVPYPASHQIVEVAPDTRDAHPEENGHLQNRNKQFDWEGDSTAEVPISVHALNSEESTRMAVFEPAAAPTFLDLSSRTTELSLESDHHASPSPKSGCRHVSASHAESTRHSHTAQHPSCDARIHAMHEHMKRLSRRAGSARGQAPCCVQLPRGANRTRRARVTARVTFTAARVTFTRETFTAARVTFTAARVTFTAARVTRRP